MVALPFDSTGVQPASVQAGQLPVSDGNGHPVMIVNSEFKPTKDNPNAGYLEFTLRVYEGPHTGDEGPYRLNLWNPNQQTVEIAHKQLSAVCRVTGKFKINDTSELHGIPFRAIVGEQNRSSNYKPGDPVYTQVRGVKDVYGNEAAKSNGPGSGAPAVTTVAQPQPQPQPNGTAPPPNAFAPPNPATPQPWAPNAAGGNAAPNPPPWSK